MFFSPWRGARQVRRSKRVRHFLRRDLVCPGEIRMGRRIVEFVVFGYISALLHGTIYPFVDHRAKKLRGFWYFLWKLCIFI
jgi:hypothetical protein